MSETFPSIATPQFPIGVENENPAIVTSFENGTEQTRARFTRLRKTFTLIWRALSNADHALLRTFWDTVKGGSESFTWTDPYDDTSYTVRFADTIKETWITPDYWAVEITLKEI